MGNNAQIARTSTGDKVKISIEFDADEWDDLLDRARALGYTDRHALIRGLVSDQVNLHRNP